MRKIRRKGFALVVGLGCTFASATSVATPAPPGQEGGSKEDGAKLGRQGLQAFNSGDFESARQLFVRAYAISPTSKILVNLAIAELNSENWLDAAGHFRMYLKASDAAPERARLVRTDLLPRAYAKVLRVIVPIPNGTRVELDGRPATSSSAEDETILTNPGEHVLRVGDGPDVKFTGEPGQVVHVALPPPRPARGKLDLVPLLARKPLVGPSDQDRELAQDDGLSPRSWALLGGTALTALAGGTGVFFGLRARSEKGDEERQLSALTNTLGGSACVAPSSNYADDCGELQATSARRARDAKISIGAFIGAGVAAAATVTTFLVWKPSRARGSAVIFTPIIGVDTVQLTATGFL